MRTRIAVTLLLLGAACSAYAGVQNIEVGGELRIRGRWWHNGWDGNRETRVPDFFLPYRAIGPWGASTVYDWDNAGADRKIVEQRTALHVRADFTDDVCALIDLHDWAIWGEDFRSNYITGADSRANSSDDLEVFQAYIEMNNILDQPLRLRIGRQALVLGKGWLVGDMVSPTLGISYDGIRLTYDPGPVSVDAFWMKLVERSPAEEDGDVDMYGVYATYKDFDPLKVSAYWLWVRDARRINDTNFIAPLEWLEDAFDLDDYDVTNLHTLGIRAFGAAGGFDYDLELAYQIGNADAVGAGYVPAEFLYGDDDADFDAFAGDIEIGYTLPIAWSPRIYVGGAYFEGNDERDLSFLEWANPFDRPDASVSFNRLFSKVWYSGTFDILGGAAALSNFYQVRGGVILKPRDNITTGVKLAYFWVEDEFDRPLTIDVDYFAIPVAPALPFLTEKSSTDIGLLATVFLKYNYSEDLFITVGWEHLFAGDGVQDGSFIMHNGLDFGGGSDKDDADYIFFDTGIKF